MLAQFNCITSQPVAMTFGVGIASFNTESKRTENRLCGLKLVRKFLEFEQGLHSREEFLRKNWLIQEIVGSGLDAAKLVFAIAKTCYEDHRNQAGDGAFLDLTADFVS